MAENKVYRFLKENILFLWALLSMYGCNLLMQNTSIVLKIILYVSFCFFYNHPQIRNIEKYRESSLLSILFTVFLALGNDWLGTLLKSAKDFISVVVAFAGIYLFFKYFLDWLYIFLYSKDYLIRKQEIIETRNIRKIFLISFFIFWTIYLIFFLNQYPGSLSVDTRAQLAQVMGVKPYENANPLIHTLTLAACVKLGIGLFHNINAGIAVYTFFQLTLVAVVFAYVVSVIYKKGYHKIIVFFTQLYFGFIPYNIVYATNMWKDTFFSIIFLLTITYLWDIIEEDRTKSENIILFLLSLVCSLARNSGWSALIVMVIFLMPYAIKKNKSLINRAMVILGGIVSALLIILVVYPFLGVTSNGGNVVALSVPLQQMSRVIVMGEEVTDEEKEILERLINIEKIPDIYDEVISDPIKNAVNKTELEENMPEFLGLWIKLGLKYPKHYLDAYIALTKNYWFPDASSGVWDIRILENEYGVMRTPQIFKNINFDTFVSEVNCRIPINSSITLWLLMICFMFASIKKNKIGMILFCPILAIYIGLMFTSPIALFRYTYGAIVSIPLFICLPYSKEKKGTINGNE